MILKVLLPVFCASLCAAASASSPLTIEDVLEASEQISKASDFAQPSQASAYLLVSLSMPPASLKRLAQDAKDAGVPLVFRGVPETEASEGAKPLPLLNPRSMAAFAPLIEIGASVELNPELFAEYSVKEAPVLLLVKEEKNSAGQCAQTSQALLVPGDVTLGFALDRIIERNDAFREKARELRGKLGGRA